MTGTPDETPKAPTRLDRREAMEAVAERVGGEFFEGKVTGGFGVDLEHGPWTIRLDLHPLTTGAVTLMHTRVWAYFVGREDLRLLVRRRTFLDRLRVLGGPDQARFGGHELARRYVAIGRPESRVRSLLSGGLGEVLARQPSVRLEIRRPSWWRRRSLGPYTRMVQVASPGVDTDADRMVGLLDVGREALEALRRIGAASAERAREG